ncbi:SHOCT domain-containing protein [Aneurinibacillus sp. Ricciae_BoGa-3]|uniref:SHOCT domain-containing protein n=1 Tax=Aneurinibacillus sp. Ricciae_BoGa-3 TaxID=3022697 RepID=UPI00234006E4|nr:SHOCT domain-containing protein [Aneurinibacillus sp. Ricciae_BoGa-3]WCK52972.1 SHOCT domain-containing protein [Aneurinibacillus sp. Ricciae_BoGa-3]
MMNGSMMTIMCMMMFIGMLLFVLVVGATVYVVTRLLMKKSNVEDYPLMIVKERYVKGEMNEEEYRLKRNILHESK